MNKSELRKWAKAERKKSDIKNISIKLAQKLQKTEEYRQAKNIMIFYPLENEVDLLSILNDKGKHFYLPKVSGKDLLCCPYCTGDELCKSCFNTQEPLSDGVDKALIDLVIVPALACDINNYRLGYGGGFYDRFLSNSNVKKIVCIPKEFVVETIYPEVTDIPVDKVVTA
ncbi:MAG: 5-formyltetrahydrofolate cyclo-ligase [bacterium]|nr:5-formyltetrahydrofolate cyclo-ligase [bacterium]